MLNETYTFKSRLNVNDALMKLENEVEKINENISLSILQKSTKIFEGKVSGNTFNLVRNISYQNSFMPKITGSIISKNNSSEISIKMEIKKQLLIFWYCSSIFYASAIIYIVINKFLVNILPFMGYELIVFIILFLTVPFITFKIEVKKTKKIFVTLLDEV